MKPHKSVRVFKSDFLERFTHVHPLVPLLLWGPVAVALLWHAIVALGLGALAVGGVGASALLVWTLTEYALHRFIFHFEGKSAFGKRVHFLIHGLHHADAVDPTRLVMPPAASLILAAILFPLFRGVLGPVYVEPFFAFFLMGYLCYDYVHFAVHHFPQRTRVGKYLRRNHYLHHYATPDARWGVSSPLWDWVFGTLKPAEPVSRSSGVNCRPRRV